MTTIDQNGMVQLTTEEGERAQVQITEDIVREALHLEQGHINLNAHLNEKERQMTFMEVPGQKDAFKDLVNQKVAIPLRVHSQHFMLGKK